MSVFVLGSIPLPLPKPWAISVGLSAWTLGFSPCKAHAVGFIDNFNLFWNRPSLYSHSRLHPCRLGSCVLAANLQHPVQTPTCDWLFINTFHTQHPPHCTTPYTYPLPQCINSISHIVSSNRAQQICTGGINHKNRVRLNSYSHTTSYSNSSTVTMALLNVPSFLNKSFIIHGLILGILFLAETWLGTDAPVVLTQASPPNVIFLFSIRGDRKGGGTASIEYNNKENEIRQPHHV